MKRFALPLAFLTCSAGPAFAIDPGVAQGTLEIGAASVSLTHAAAHLHNNAAKVLPRARELRIVLSEREVPQSAIAGLPPLPVEAMAERGEVRGLLIVLDPNDRVRISVTLLRAPDLAGPSLTGQLASDRGVLRSFRLANNRVIGELEATDSPGASGEKTQVRYHVKFSAPVFSER